jgi:hypothetical protein
MCVYVLRRLVPIGVCQWSPDLQPGLLSYISTVCSAVHIPPFQPLLLLSRPALSFRWLSALSNFLSTISNSMARASRLWPMLITPQYLLQSTIDCCNSTLILLINRPLPVLGSALHPPSTPACRILSIRLVDSHLSPTASLDAVPRPRSVYANKLYKHSTSTLPHPPTDYLPLVRDWTFRIE